MSNAHPNLPIALRLARQLCALALGAIEVELDATAHHDRHGYGFWVVDVDGAFAGFTGLNWTEGMPFSPALEIGWRFAPAFWGRGYATEAAGAALAVGLAEAGTVVAFTAVQNEPSWRVMERISMRREAEFEHPRIPDDSPLKTHVLYRTPPGL